MARKQTILVVEDDQDLRRLFRTALTLSGYDVEEAGDGLEALQKIDYARPDLVVLDVILPEVSGLVVQREIAAHAYNRELPVVFVTGSALELSEIGSACLLRKPITPDRLVNTVRSCLAAGNQSARS
jgi:DNA-binding response OmpR family regulator